MRSGLVALFVASALMATAVASSASPGGRAFGDGIYRVGKDIRPGTYRSRGGNGCYWARLAGFSGELNDIKANANAIGPTIVTILRTDRGFETHSCGNWSSRLVRITRSKTRFGSGTFIVGLDIAPGTYRSRGGSGCYWARLKAFTGDLLAISANANPIGSTIVTISRADRGFESHSCGTWARL